MRIRILTVRKWASRNESSLHERSVRWNFPTESSSSLLKSLVLMFRAGGFSFFPGSREISVVAEHGFPPSDTAARISGRCAVDGNGRTWGVRIQKFPSTWLSISASVRGNRERCRRRGWFSNEDINGPKACHGILRFNYLTANITHVYDSIAAASSRSLCQTVAPFFFSHTRYTAAINAQIAGETFAGERLRYSRQYPTFHIWCPVWLRGD